VTLPRLYTLKEVREALNVGHEYVRRALKRYPQIRPIGKGRGTRLTYEDYMLLLELMRRPPDPIVATLPSEHQASNEDAGRRAPRAKLGALRKQLLAELRGKSK
jgi:hypothetical protein